MGSLDRRAKVGFCVALMGIMGLGAALRLWMLESQLLLDDEWHGINYVIGQPLAYVFTHQGLGANSIPMNVWRWVLLHSLGWSEMWLRFPSVIAGIASLILFPLSVRVVLDRRQTLTFAFLIAISPCLIFYSRMSRPYGMVSLLGFISLVSFYAWMVGAQRRRAVLYCVTGALAVWFHLYALIIVAVPPVVSLGLRLLSERRHIATEVSRWPPTVHIILAGVMAVLPATVLLLPAQLNNPWWIAPMGSDQVTLGTVTRYASLLSGTGNPVLIWVFVLCVGMGMYFLARRKRLLFALSAASAVVYALALGLSRQEGSHAAIQLARYTIAMFPLWMMIASYGIWEGIGAALPRLRLPRFVGHGFVWCGLLLFVVTSPLSQTFQRPNNLTNHSAFQDSYEPFTWQKSRERDLAPGFVIEKSQVSPFYLQLAADQEVDTIIEFPMLIGDNYNLHFYFQHFYFQHFHQKRVVGGYLTIVDPGGQRDTQDFVFGYMPVDLVLSRLTEADLNKTHFQNLVNIVDPAAIQESGADLIVFHRHIIQELFPQKLGGGTDPTAGVVRELLAWYEQMAGSPVYEDEHTVVYRTQLRELE